MTICNANDLESTSLTPLNQNQQNELNNKFTSNIDKLRRFGLGSQDNSIIKVQRYTLSGFTLDKTLELIQYVGFDSVGAISGTLPLATDLDIGTTFYLFNESATPATDTVTIALGSHSIINSVATSIVLNSNTFITCLTYIAANTFLAYKMDTL